MPIDRPLKDVTEADLQALISASVSEGKSIEFKREINLADDPAKRKFFASVASFANTAGGDIVFGMEAKDGVATAICPLDSFNPDTDTIRLRDLIRAHIEPKVYGFDFQAIPLKDGGCALVLRIPRTWVGAHMVIYGQQRRKGDGGKVALAQALRAGTTMPLTWIAGRLARGSRGYLAWLLSRRNPSARATST
jgi:hypothetical protein